MFRLFDRLEIETMSACNRVCPTCLRNSYPDRAKVAHYDGWTLLPFDLVLDVLRQAKALSFGGSVCLSWHNEPLMDGRIDLFAAAAHKLGFAEVFLCANGDFLTPALAQALDGHLDNIRISNYGRADRNAKMQSWFSKTRVTCTGGGHIARHFAGAPAHPGEPCEQEAQMRCIIGSDGHMRLCCEDIAGEFGLGSIYDRTLEELWFGERHRDIVERLQQPTGRAGYCLTCPQRNAPYWSVGAQQLTTGDM